MNAKLIAEEGFLKELVLSFDEGDHWVIGRDPDACQLLVEDPAASRQHLLCRKTSQGIVIENLSKTNPAKVNEEPLAEPHLLQPDDTVRIGDTLFRFFLEETPILNENHAEEEEVEEEEEKVDTIFDIEEKGDLANISFDLTDTGRWLLKVVGGPNNGAEFSMQAGNSYVIGTDPNVCDIVFYDTSVSRQHVRITISEEDEISIEDLRSRNGTHIEGELVTDKQILPLNTVVTIGTSSFVVYDREGEMQTIISPLLPSIVKTLQKEEEAKQALEETPAPPPQPQPLQPLAPKAHSHAFGAFILLASLIGLFVLVGIGVRSLFVTQEIVVQEPINREQELANVFTPFPAVKYAFNKNTGRLLVVGHVSTTAEKNELFYNLQALKFIKEIDTDGLIIDEYVWNEGNQLLSRNPAWRGITVHSPAPGQFILSGYLHSRNDAENLWDYMTRNFSFPDLLEDRVIVEEDIVARIFARLLDMGFNTVTVQVNNGELVLAGMIPTGKKADYDRLIEEFRAVPGIRIIKNNVQETARQESLINVSDKYTVTGLSRTSDGGLSVIINGRILSKGDVLDGMTVINIQPNMVLFEKNQVMYRVDILK